MIMLLVVLVVLVVIAVAEWMIMPWSSSPHRLVVDVEDLDVVIVVVEDVVFVVVVGG